MKLFRRTVPVYYTVTVNGEGLFLSDESGTLNRFGFYAVRTFLAKDTSEAKQIALEIVTRQLKARAANAENQPVRLKVEKVKRVRGAVTGPLPGDGFIFFQS